MGCPDEIIRTLSTSIGERVVHINNYKTIQSMKEIIRNNVYWYTLKLNDLYISHRLRTWLCMSAFTEDSQNTKWPVLFLNTLLGSLNHFGENLLHLVQNRRERSMHRIIFSVITVFFYPVSVTVTRTPVS